MDPRRGAVAVLDALGFKGIWKRRDPRAILDRLKLISEESKRMAELVLTTGFQDQPFGSWKACDVVVLQPNVAHFSDSVIFCCGARPGPLFEKVSRQDLSFNTGLELFALNYLTFALSMMIAEGASQEPCFVYRGAVATGDFWFEEPSFILGEAIDEAAEHERTAEAAVVQCCASARSVLDRAGLWCPAVVKDYPVPLKGDRSFQTHVINPFAMLPLIGRSVRPKETRRYTDYALAQLSKRLLAFMESDDSGVQAKRRNTEKFLGVAAAQLHFAPNDT